MPIISHIYMDDLFFPFIYQQPKSEIFEQISLYIEDMTNKTYKKKEDDDERVVILDIL